VREEGRRGEKEKKKKRRRGKNRGTTFLQKGFPPDPLSKNSNIWNGL
jgi:hypothetical protein